MHQTTTPINMEMDLGTCRDAIASIVPLPRQEHVPVANALARICAVDHQALLPLPGYRQSLRDGFVVTATTCGTGDDCRLPITAIIGAGDAPPPPLAPHETFRIMTGAMVPENGVRIIPQERCRVAGETVHIAEAELRGPHSYIREAGSELAAGSLIARRGEMLQARQLELLTAAGHHQLNVAACPRVGFLCTGSELVSPGQTLHTGQKISSNEPLLASLLHAFGAIPVSLGTIADTRKAMAATFETIKDQAYNLAISTGGMGRGRYDLVEEMFRAAGGEVIYNRLSLQPGKRSLFGRLNDTLFFGLPGPPTAVLTLLHTLVGPTLLRLQGARHASPSTVTARLSQPLTCRRPGIMQLQGGLLGIQDGQCLVHPTTRLETPNCYLVLDAGRTSWVKDEPVTVELCRAGAGLPSFPA